MFYQNLSRLTKLVKITCVPFLRLPEVEQCLDGESFA